MSNAFTIDDIGCYADGTFGHGGIRGRLAELVEAVDGGIGNPESLELVESLGGSMPDDCWDEDRAIELLDEATADGLEWRIDAGDLLLCEMEGEL
jgi:hypothetical protein